MVDRKRGLNGLFGHIHVVAVAGCEKVIHSSIETVAVHQGVAGENMLDIS